MFELQGALLVERDHRDAGVDVAKDLRLRRRIDAVRELGKPLVQPLPERDPLLDRWRPFDRAETGDMLMPDLAVYAAGLDEAYLQPVSVSRKRRSL